MSKSKSVTKKGSEKPVDKALTKVKDAGVTKHAQSPKGKSKQIARELAAKEEKTKRKKKAPTPSSSSESESDEEMDSSSSSESESEDEKPVKKEMKKDAKKEAEASSESESDSESESESSDEDMKDASSSESESESEEEKKPAKKVKAEPKAAKKAESSESDSSESENSDSDSDEESSEQEKATTKAAAESSDSEESESESEEEAPAEANQEESEESDSSESESESETEQSNESAKKKRKAEEEPSAAVKKSKTSEPASGDSSNLFVGNLSWNVDEEWLQREFQGFDGLTGVRIMTERDSGRSRGFGYVEFSNGADAAKAYEAMKDAEIDGRKINLDYASGRPANKEGGFKERAQNRARSFGDQASPESDTLFVGNLPFSATEDSVHEVFGSSGSVLGIRLPTHQESGQPKGFGYVQFSSVDEARQAYNELQGAELDGRPLRLDFSTPRDNNGGGRGGRGGGRGGPRGGSRGGPRGGGRGGRGGFGGRGGGSGGPPNRARGGIPEFKGTKMTF